MNDITWKDVLYPHKRYGDISEIWNMACLADYKYFCWNDRIYHTSNCYDSGLTIKDIK